MNKLDTALVDAATAVLAAAQSRLDTATAALVPLKAHAHAATEAAEAAIVSGDKDAHELAEAAHLASRRLQTGERVRDSAHAALQEARQGIERATSIAWRAPLLAAVQKRLDASKAADAARRALADAEASYTAATAAIADSINQGAEDFLFGNWRHHSLVDYQTETKRWTENYHVNWFSPDMLQA